MTVIKIKQSKLNKFRKCPGSSESVPKVRKVFRRSENIRKFRTFPGSYGNCSKVRKLTEIMRWEMTWNLTDNENVDFNSVSASLVLQNDRVDAAVWSQIVVNHQRRPLTSRVSRLILGVLMHAIPWCIYLCVLIWTINDVLSLVVCMLYRSVSVSRSPFMNHLTVGLGLAVNETDSSGLDVPTLAISSPRKLLRLMILGGTALKYMQTNKTKLSRRRERALQTLVRPYSCLKSALSKRHLYITSSLTLLPKFNVNYIKRTHSSAVQWEIGTAFLRRLSIHHPLNPPGLTSQHKLHFIHTSFICTVCTINSVSWSFKHSALPAVR